MRDSKVIQSLAGLVTLGAAASLCLTLQGGCDPRLDPRPHEAAGWFMAQQALRHLQPGGQVVVITRDTRTFKNPATEVLLAGLLKTLRKARVTVGSITSLQVDPLRPVEVPPGDFQELIRKASWGLHRCSVRFNASTWRKPNRRSWPFAPGTCPSGPIYRLCLNKACFRRQ